MCIGALSLFLLACASMKCVWLGLSDFNETPSAHHSGGLVNRAKAASYICRLVLSTQLAGDIV